MLKKLMLFLGFVVCLSAADLRIAAGAGYKKMTAEIIENFDKKDKIQAIYGNMKQVSEQAKNADISIIIGDKSYLDKTDLKKIKEQKVGTGKLVVIFPKDKKFVDLQSLKDTQFSKIAIPDAKKAIYGIAATEAMKSLNLDISKKLIFVSTVPQAASYVLSGEVEAGFVNFSEALSIKDKIGQIYKVDESLYSPIIITAFALQSCYKNELCGEFLEFLQSDKAKSIVNKYGL